MGNAKKLSSYPEKSSVASKVKYVKLAYQYFLTHIVSLKLNIIIFTIIFMLQQNVSQLLLQVNFLWAPVVIYIAILYFMTSKPRKIYMLDFACYKPGEASICSKERFMKCSTLTGKFTKEILAFQKKILERSGLGEKTYMSESLMKIPPEDSCMGEARKEAEMIMFGAIDQLLEKVKTHVKVKDIGILVVNCSMFNPTPSLSAAIVNRYKLRPNILSYNLSGMGCSAGMISIDLAKRRLQMRRNCYALIMNLECQSPNCWYQGNERSMLIANCIFRLGGAAILLSNNSLDRFHSKYELTHTVRTHTGADDKSYNSVVIQEDDNKNIGIKLSKHVQSVAGEALKTNIAMLGPLVLPVSEKLSYLSTLVANKFLKMKMKAYVPDFKLTFEHFCVHAGGRIVLDEVEKNLKLTEWHMEPSRMSLYRFGNNSSCTVWYELAYSEAKGRIKKGDRVWQIGFGSGFKCNSSVWRAMKSIDPAMEKMKPWFDEIHEFPVHVPEVDVINC